MGGGSLPYPLALPEREIDMDMPLVDVVFITWNRPRVMVRTWAALKERLMYPNLRWVVADDCSPDEVLEEIRDVLRPDIIFRTKERSGWGLNVNNALKQLDSEFVFQTEDDKLLKEPLDLVPGVKVLAARVDFGMVRYWGLAGHALFGHLREIRAEGKKFNVWHLLKNSPFLYVYSNGAHLKHRRFHEAYGYYPEGYKLGYTEERFAHTFIDDKEGPGIVAFPDFVRNRFEDIAKSWQLTEVDIGKGMGEK